MAQRTESDASEGLEVDRLASREETEPRADGVGQAGRRGAGSGGWRASFGSTGLLLLIVGAVLGIVAIILLLGGGSYWWLPLAFAVLLAAFGGVVYFLLDRTTEVEKPSAETVARLEEEGVRDPERAVNERVDAAPEDEQGEADAQDALDRRAEGQPRDELAEEQKGKITPSSSASRPVGPGPGGDA